MNNFSTKNYNYCHFNPAIHDKAVNYDDNSLNYAVFQRVM